MKKLILPPRSILVTVLTASALSLSLAVSLAATPAYAGANKCDAVAQGQAAASTQMKVPVKAAAQDVIAEATAKAEAAAQADLAQPEFSAKHALRIDSEDLENIKERKTGLQKLAELFGRGKANNLDLNDPAQRVELLVKSGEFHSWFATADSIARDLDERDEEVPVLTKPVANPQEGLLAKLMMIRNAKHTVDLTYYIFESDPSGLSVLNELKDAVARGVNVRLMVDSLGSLSESMHGNVPIKSLLDHAKKNAGFLTDENGNPTKVKAQVEFVIFNPMSALESLPRNLVRGAHNLFVKVLNALAGTQVMPLPSTQWSINRRSHDKILVVDALYPKLAIGIFGGRNIADRYFETNPKLTGNYVDYEEIVRNDPNLVDGMAADQNIGHAIHTLFERLYFHTANREVSRGLIGRVFGNGLVAKMEEAKQIIGTNTAAVLKDLGEDINSPTFGQKYLQEGFLDGQAEVVSTIANIERQHAARKSGVSDNMQGIRSGNSLLDGLARALKDSARAEAETGEAEELTLISPYIWLAGRDASLLKKWLLENPKRKLNIMTNSIMTTDNLPAQILVDVSLGQSFAEDVGLKNAKGEVIRRSIKDQVTIYAYGRDDSTDLGGSKVYSKLHEKGFALKVAKVNAVITYNQDPRSRFLNSESGLIIKSQGSTASRLAHFEDLKAQSTIWGSAEWQSIRSRMTGAKKEIVDHTAEYFKSLQLADLWWMI